MKFKKIVKEYGRKVYPAANGCTINDMGDCFIVTNKMGLNIGQCRTMIEAETIADEADERTKERCLSAGNDREWEMYQKMSESTRRKQGMKKIEESGKSLVWCAMFSDGTEKKFRSTKEDAKNKAEEYADAKGIEVKKVYPVLYPKAVPRYAKFAKESTADNDGVPRIYVGTYAKYNDGSIDGKWIDLSKYNTYEEFVDACRELHKDEKDPEFMVQDYENFPRKWYHEGGLPTEEEFDKINEFYLMDDNEKAAYEAFVNYTNEDDIEKFHDAYEGQFDSATDFAYHMVDSIGWDGIGQDTLEMYFDYDSFGRDLMYDFHRGDEDNTDADGNPEDPDHYYDNEGYDMGEYESDQQVAYDYIDNLGGVDQLGADTAQNYFDYESFGRDLLINDYFEEDGYVFSRNY